MDCGGAWAGQRDAAAGCVRITASEVAASHLLPRVLAALRTQHPAIQIELVASNALSNLLRREADIAVRMVRPAQPSLIARKLGDVPIVACAHERYLQRAGTPREPADLLRHTLIGYDQDDTILRGMRRLGFDAARAQFALRTDDQRAYAQLIAVGAGIGFLARYSVPQLPGVVPLLPDLAVAPLPCWLAVHREIRGSRLVRTVYDFLAEALPRELGG